VAILSGLSGLGFDKICFHGARLSGELGSVT